MTTVEESQERETVMHDVPPAMRPVHLRHVRGVVDLAVRRGVPVIAWVHTPCGVTVWRNDAAGWYRA